jgi:hypothetical protein
VHDFRNVALVALAKSRVKRELRLVAELEHDGRDTAHAKALLITFEQSYTLRVIDRDRLRKELRPHSLPPQVLR